MIIFSKGDLLEADVEALVNTVNCVGVMGKGIALQFKRRYPDMFKKYAAACKCDQVKIGKMMVVPTGQISGPQFIINFPTKVHWRSPSKLAYIDAGLVDLKSVIEEYQISSIAIPPLGVGNGGLSWPEVEKRIVRAFSDMPNTTVHVYSPSAQVRSIDAPTNIRMTWGRALLLDLIRNYVVQRQGIEPWENTQGASHLEIQKLMYFANYVEPKLNLNFSPNRYGPYSDKVRHLIQNMEGAYLKGFGDGSTKVLENQPIGLTVLAEKELSRYKNDRNYSHQERVVQAVLRFIEGFEGPYGLELLASTHWVTAQENVSETHETAAAVRSWTKRKGRLYADDRIESALRHIKSPVGSELIEIY
ncbi:macro domain-containing protein [Nocardiopsis sp. EMB25]|uniref:type II toxin-antitoxin system antitoxin DNA ADP-ribosyl glycohydrolase DarG n=1 Tax=Nocardiopsis sp. EMB25 TaxID=2835867 RepID=UPI002283C343|nr:macro domain-containing protein [Nocardiopsis sp. EMB25]MCY9786684.1 macro domain-containing protein [Nocardiopsis sp. EMB25]